ncbi:MAG: tRNA (N(6)-L-threonylcarbamoyladenosine(37)-C(2))-methylthiotransferase MtaB [Chloroflexi bacterium]|nr:tRNA (N(6)-L-threonylcarbamoyladenosine(37)-C(2))-methylthiotransferase MtaB [Chloroflexota bacterium]
MKKPNPTAAAKPDRPDPAYRGTVAIHTHGCKLNQADSDQLARQFAAAGYRIVESASQADVFVLNTCTVTATADAKARKALRRVHRANPEALIVATGCYAQRSAEELDRMDAVSLVIGNTQKFQLPSLVDAILAEREKTKQIEPPGLSQAILVPDQRDGNKPVAVATKHARSRAMIKIQEGCNQVCAYCIVPKVRGRERSIPPGELVGLINQRVAQGCQEVVLTGTQLGTYGFDLPDASLLQLLERILAETDILRLRVSSLQPQEISAELLALWQDPRLCPHFHLPLQSGSDTILPAMRRRYTTGQFAKTVDLIRQMYPDAGITADLIVGFPGESDGEFRESRAFVQAMEFSDMHVFPFSPRPGTGAVHLGGHTPEPVKKERTAEMLAVARTGFLSFRSQQLGQTRRVLWEGSPKPDGDRRWTGLTDNYIRVRTAERRELGNTITPAKLTELIGEEVAAELI